VTLIDRFRSSPRTAAGLAMVIVTVTAGAYWSRSSADPSLVATVQRGELVATLTTTGTLKPVQAITYRSPVNGREAEVIGLAAEGSHVKSGDVLVRLDTTELMRELERGLNEIRQQAIDLQVAEGELTEAQEEVKSVAQGEGALTVEEARSTLVRAEKKAERLREEFAKLKPLLDKGFITREELARTQDALETAEDEFTIAKKRTSVIVEMSHPREQQRAALLLAQKTQLLGQARSRLQETQARMKALGEVIDACTIRTRGPGLVVYEENLTANPRRKLRVGDRVFSSQGLVTIPEVTRMVVEGSVSESEVHRVRPGQPATVFVEAFPGLHLTGRVGRVGALATSSVMRPFDDKRFDLIIELDPSDAELRPEMTVRADVIVGTRQKVLLVPVTAVFNRQGSFVAYVTGVTGVETRPVDLGESNDRHVEVVAGLREGERVSLVEPPGAATTPAGAPANPSGARGNAPQPR
jgi:multidrug efflux pump subunit AcrA (membrane-fusion protein)